MIREKITETGILHYSDTYHKIRQVETGTIYDSAEDIIPCPYTYEETDELIGIGEADPADVVAELESVL